MRVSAWVCICAAILSATVGCASSGGDDSRTDASGTQSTAETAAVRPTLTNPKIQPPSQDSNQYSSGLPKVVFDPCTWISDQTIQKAGFDPSSRHRGTDFVAEQNFLTCGFSGAKKGLILTSGNVPWDQDLQKVAGRNQPTTINGRQAVWVSDPQFPENCEIDLRTKVGFVQMVTSLNLPGEVKETPACDGMLNTATLIEAEIGKGN